MITLGVDTSSKACSCALLRDGVLLGESYCNNGLTHSATLMVLVENMLKTADLPFEAIDRLAVSVGPGSYTGLRIGLAAVKGMALAYDTPCVGVSTLLSLAYNVLPFEGVVCAALDARVGQVFAALFRIENGRVTRVTADDAMTLEALGALLPDGAMLCGDGAQLVYGHFTEKRLRLSPASLQYQRAASVAWAAQTEGYPALSASALAAEYHRKSQAEREREAKQQLEE
ncbi:MAG TPA: tRNA (adenosine(37)-N6)-threonylcarbamoyltransferase complex dimerization subunit type 1 TsaB [Clostridia bacterium]|nr:tRNA (adenosine(37)-N6)-threonylcarbamoyltransferase complex dimerization subunit type 1 TsaB [Clostridia bacterium]